MKFTGRFLTAVVLICLLPCCVFAAEEIVAFHQNIAIQKNSDIYVTENITLNVENIAILHGIKRVFPTTRKDTDGRSRPIGFEVEKTLLDGKQIEYSTDYSDDNAIVKIGSAESIIPRGRHTFTLCYTAKGEIGFFDDHDELYWNVTGNGWTFPILSASCEVKLPKEETGAGFENIAWYMGKFESKDTTGAALTKNDGIKTTRTLKAGEGLTVVYSWKKGIVNEPPLPKTDDPVSHTLFGAIVFIIIFFWLIFAWNKWGRDPQKTVIPIFTPPVGLSPAAVAYADTLRFENKTFLPANIIDMAVKGLLTIEQTDGEQKLIFKTNTSYTLHKTDGQQDKLTADEKAIYAQLFNDGDTLQLSKENADTLFAAQTVAKDNCKTCLGKLYEKNGKVFSVAALVYVIGIALLWFNSEEDFPLDMFMCGLAGFATLAVNLKIDSTPASVKFGNFALRIAAQTVITLLGAFILWACENSIIPFIVYCASLCVISVFCPLMPARNGHGAELYAAAEGLKLYMTTAEKERLEMLNPPDETPQLFEKLLPYALALGIAETWANRFSAVLETAKYHPQWCYGGDMVWLPYNFTRDFGNNIHTASAFSTQNFGGSWDSGFGGGFSGGGGGGGGGSGW